MKGEHILSMSAKRFCKLSFMYCGPVHLVERGAFLVMYVLLASIALLRVLWYPVCMSAEEDSGGRQNFSRALGSLLFLCSFSAHFLKLNNNNNNKKWKCNPKGAVTRSWLSHHSRLRSWSVCVCVSGSQQPLNPQRNT